MLTNWGDLLTNVPSNGGGAAIAPADYANTITVANQAARLALVYGTGTGQVQELDQVFQTSDSTLWVLLASDPSVSGNWGPLNSFPASAITSGTLDAARIHASMTADKLGYLSSITSSVQTQLNAKQSLLDVYQAGSAFVLDGRYLDYSGAGTPGTTDVAIGGGASGLHYQVATGDQHRKYVAGTCYANLSSTGLAINKATTAASKMLEVVDSAAAQMRLTHTAATDYADFTVDTDGILTINPSGSLLSAAKGLRIDGGYPSSIDNTLWRNASDRMGVAATGGIDFYIATAAGTKASLNANGWGVGLDPGVYASYPIHAQATSGDQLRLQHSAANYFGVAVGSGGNANLFASGNITLQGDNRAAYDASPSATTIRDILISHGLMAAS